MSDLQYFQRYHGRENTHSSNALFLLKRLYFYSPKKFYEVLSALFEKQGGLENTAPNFVVQDTTNGKDSIPDFSIMQPSFKIVVEAKEGSFSIGQLERHLNGLSNLNGYTYKILIALSPKNDVQNQLDVLQEKYNDIIIVHKSYLDFYNVIIEVLDEIKDLNFTEILDDYKEYCEQEGLIDYSYDTLMVRLTGDTFDFNFSNGLYYDSTKQTPYGFRYLGLYKEQHVKAIGKIVKIVEAHVTDNGTIEYGKPVLGKALTEEDKRKIDAAIEDRRQRYQNETTPHWHFIVDKFVEVINFKKKKYALYGKKKFYLKEDFGIQDIKKCTIKDIAKAMENYDKWK